ncbi:MAG: deoxyribose-phosphate aldolase [Acidimicrobiales bacterium]|nr:deoxyribose-phosphate aldolase [Acidimicrobiales bacterium]
MTGPTLAEPDPTWLAQAWLRVDPNPNTRQEVAELLSHGGAALTEAFTARLAFGTAGIRAPLGAGPGRMNRVLVRLVASALGTRLQEMIDRPHVVVGYDARHRSDAFAHDTARVLAGRGIQVSLIDQPRPTPLLAFSVRHLRADAGVMVTASHNPRTDNGYKVYWHEGEPLRSPIDAEIAALVNAAPLVGEDELVALDHSNITEVDHQMVEAYLGSVTALLHGGGGRSARVAYTPLHGVGAGLMTHALQAGGFPPPAIVDTEADPDPNFPGMAFPNPEEPGVLDGLFALAAKTEADVALANDPDADRLAVAVPADGAWRLLSGDEVGIVLADHLLRQLPLGDAGLLVNTIVSSRLLEVMAAEHGATFERTLVGFKHIMAAQHHHPEAPFVLGYEEALGYCVGNLVRDKDGIGAALVIAELVSDLADAGESILDRLDHIHHRFGVHVSGQRTVRYGDEAAVSPAQAVDALRAAPIDTLADEVVTSVTDLAQADNPTNALIFNLDHARLTARPSGTEAKLKIYGETWAEPPTDDPGQLTRDRTASRQRLNRLLDALGGLLSDPERRQTATATAAGPGDHDAADRAQALFGEPLSDRADSPLSRAAALRLIVRCIDLTTLAGDDTPGRVRSLCAQARRPDSADPTVGPTAAVCVYPNLVGLVAELCQGTRVNAASVAGAFPSGLSPASVRIVDVHEAIAAGADEVDVVLNRSAFLAGDTEQAQAELHEYRRAARSKLLKVILEVDELGAPAAIRKAAGLAIEAGADFIKTSTGKSSGGATPESVLAMAEAIAAHTAAGGEPVGLKISGGVRTADEALGYLSIVHATLGAAWLTPSRLRFGASSLLGAVVGDLAATEADPSHR